MLKNKLSSLVRNQFPDFYKEDGQNFLAFIEGYYEYLEQNGKLTDAIQSIQDYRSIDTTLDEYIDYFQNTLLPSVPHDVIADKRLLAKYVKYFNVARGTLASYKLLFRSIYNEDIEVNYPADQMLKVSDGDWRLDQYLVTNYDKKVFDLIGKIIVGQNSTAEALVEDVVGRVVRNRDVLQIIVSKVRGEFQNLESIKANGGDESYIIEAGISNLELVSSGGGYQPGDSVDIISDDAGIFGKVVVSDTVDLLGSITFDLADGGSGYTSDIYGLDQGETQIFIRGGDGEQQPSFTLSQPDISDNFAIAFNTNLIGSNNIFGSHAPNSYENDTVLKMSSFANTIIGSPQFGFPEQNQVVTDGIPFLTSSNSLITVANSKNIFVGDSITGSATGANGHVQQIVDGTNGATILRVDTFKNFTSSVHNYFKESENVNANDHWALSRSDTPTDNHVTAPDGTLTAENLIEDTTGGATNQSHYIGVKSTAISHTTADTWNFSCYARAISAGSKRWLGFRGLGNGGNNKYPVFDVADGVIADAGDGSLWTNVQMQAVGGGWYRCSAATQPGNTTTGFRFTLLNVGNNDAVSAWEYVGDGASGLAIWGCQQTLGADLKPYHRTTATETVGSGEYIHIGQNVQAANVGKVTAYSANNIGDHVLELGILGSSNISVGDELVSVGNSTFSGKPSFAVVKQILSTQSNGYDPAPPGSDTRDLLKLKVAANNTSGVCQQFQTGGLSAFIQGQNVRKVGSSTVQGVVATTSSNTTCEHVYTKLEDSLIFKTATFGTITNLSNRVGGSGFTVAPTVKLVEPNISALGIGEQYITIETDDVNWNTSDSSVTGLDTNDRVVQIQGKNGTASGDVKGGARPAVPPTTIQLANGKYQTTIRVWQDFLQREPSGIEFKVGETITIEKYTGEYIPGELDTRTVDSTGSATITAIQDEGVLGRNAIVNATVGANGTITSVKVIDSGFSYKDKEIVRIQDSGRSNSTQATARLKLKGTANSQGYYATSRSHVSTKRGFIQDSSFYQEYSYELISPISLERYKDVALKLVHPAGQTLFGRYQAHSNVNIDVTTDKLNTKAIKGAGTLFLTNSTTNISSPTGGIAKTRLVGVGTEFTDFNSGDEIIIKVSTDNYVKVKLNIIHNDTAANLHTHWELSPASGVEYYYNTANGTIT